tara:strand:+ start:1938 stop:2627 length:690 start_codon:yes stop_codon:yes gene_type:complete
MGSKDSDLQNQLDSLGGSQLGANAYMCLGLDISTRMGYALMSYNKDTKTAILLKYGLIITDTSKRSEGEYINEFYLKIGKLLNKYQVHICFIEDFFMRGGKCQGLAVNWYLRSAVYMQCANYGIEYRKFSSFIWKKEILKNTVQLTAKQRKMMKNYQKEIIKMALESRFSITYPEKMRSNKTKNQIKFVDDIYDATGQAIYGLLTEFKIENIKVINKAESDGGGVEYIN